MHQHPETFEYKHVDGLTLHADFYRSPMTPTPAPLIIWLHGGALIFGSRTRLNPALLRRYLAAGYAVLAIDYRLAPETKLPLIIEDVQDAFAWVRQQGMHTLGIDPERVAVMGESAGGYLALMSGFAVSPRPRALVVLYGYGDIVGDWYTQPAPFYNQQPPVSQTDALAAIGTTPIADAPGRERIPFYIRCRQLGSWPSEVTRYDPEREGEAFIPFCPVHNVTTAYPPTILLHGDLDDDVPYAQSTTMAAALNAANVEHRLITIPGGGHGFDTDADSPHVQPAFDAVVAFLNHHLTLPA